MHLPSEMHPAPPPYLTQLSHADEHDEHLSAHPVPPALERQLQHSLLHDPTTVTEAAEPMQRMMSRKRQIMVPCATFEELVRNELLLSVADLSEPSLKVWVGLDDGKERSDGGADSSSASPWKALGVGLIPAHATRTKGAS